MASKSRAFAQGFFSISLLLLAAVGVSGQNDAPPLACRAIPGGADWPAPNIWAQLNETTGGRLMKPSPPGAVCHTSQPTFDAGQCYAVAWGWSDEFFHARDPVSAYWDNWNNDTCLPDPLYPCSAAGYPTYVINATTPDHIKAGIVFGLMP
jgi:hypothetical protein